VTPFPYLRMELFYSAFGKKNRVAPFFVWLKSRIERSRSILCLDREPYACRGVERTESAHVRESASIRSFFGARAFQLLIVNFDMKIREPLHSYFVGNQTSRKLERNHYILTRSSTKRTISPYIAKWWD
jgi:hypothetical protein